MLGFINIGSSLDEFITKRTMPFHGIKEYSVGNNNGWSWIKYINGFAECWGNKIQSTLTNYSQVGSFYGYMQTFNWPFTWYEIPQIIYSMQVGSGFAMPGAAVMGVTVAQGRAYCLATASGSQTVTSNVYAWGKWKKIDETAYI